jgi:sugar lactone lactonase YvrE
LVGSVPRAVFINTKNSVYVAGGASNKIFQFSVTNPTPIRNISSGVSNPYSVFVAADENLFVNNYGSGYAVNMWTSNSTVGVLLMNLTSSCFRVFVDVNGTLYCSLDTRHVVLAVSLNAATNTAIVVAGTGVPALASTQLNGPRGIYVDTGFNLYIADSANNRIQVFNYNQLIGITVAGTGAPGTIPLSYPTDLVADGNGYLFIVESFSHRVVSSGPNGLRCIVACSGQLGSSPSGLNYPGSLAFDTDGNLFIADTFNGRIQKFLLSSNSCGMFPLLKGGSYTELFRVRTQVRSFVRSFVRVYTLSHWLIQ